MAGRKRKSLQSSSTNPPARTPGATQWVAPQPMVPGMNGMPMMQPIPVMMSTEPASQLSSQEFPPSRAYGSLPLEAVISNTDPKALNNAKVVAPGRRPRGVTRMCSNCETTSTPLWRTNSAGLRLCNACAIYAARHHRPRPVNANIPYSKNNKKLKADTADAVSALVGGKRDVNSLLAAAVEANKATTADSPTFERRAGKRAKTNASANANKAKKSAGTETGDSGELALDDEDAVQPSSAEFPRKPSPAPTVSTGAYNEDGGVKGEATEDEDDAGMEDEIVDTPQSAHEPEVSSVVAFRNAINSRIASQNLPTKRVKRRARPKPTLRDTLKALQTENEALKKEVAFLRAHLPHVGFPPTPSGGHATPNASTSESMDPSTPRSNGLVPVQTMMAPAPMPVPARAGSTGSSASAPSPGWIQVMMPYNGQAMAGMQMMQPMMMVPSSPSAAAVPAPGVMMMAAPVHANQGNHHPPAQTASGPATKTTTETAAATTKRSRPEDPADDHDDNRDDAAHTNPKE